MPTPAQIPIGVKDPSEGVLDFQSVFEAELDYVCGSLRRLGVHSRDLEDLAQDVFIAMHRHFSQYDPRRPLRPWIFGFVYLTASNYRRLSRHQAEVFEDRAEELIEPASPEDELVSVQLEKRFWAALDRLSDELRAVFVMHELDEMSGPDIAESLGIPLNTAYSRIRAARLQMEKRLSDSASSARRHP